MRKAAFAFALCQACTLAVAQTAPAAGASFACGGVAQDEQEAMKAQARQHDLMLTFAVSSGAYLADVDVEIRDSRGAVVLSAKCEGPIMLVDLPGAGTWRVSAQVNGQTRRQTVTTTGRARPARATLIWPTAP
jgi:hypothetical protein